MLNKKNSKRRAEGIKNKTGEQKKTGQIQF
jgi:hypothetical protein